MPSERMDGTADFSDAGLASVDLGIDDSSVASSIETTPDYVQCETGLLLVDASVDSFPLEKNSSLLMRRVEWDASLLEELFLGGSVTKRDETSYLGMPYVALEGSEGSLGYMPGAVYYSSKLNSSGYYEVPLLKCTSSSAYEAYFPQCDLAGLTVGEASAKAAALFDELGVTTYGQPEIYSLTAEALNSALAENAQDDELAELPGIDEGDLSRVYGTQDEVMILRYQLSADGLPLTQSSFTDSNSDRYAGGSSAEVWLSASGVERLNVTNAVSVSGEIGSSDSMVALDEALNKAAEKYADVISASKINVRSIRLEYAAYPEDDNVLDCPYCLSWVLSPGLDQEKSEPVIKVNAFTGEVS